LVHSGGETTVLRVDNQVRLSAADYFDGSVGLSVIYYYRTNVIPVKRCETSRYLRRRLIGHDYGGDPGVHLADPARLKYSFQ
jgi:hypothetical protein